MPDKTPPIEVSSSALPTTLAAVLRYAIGLAGSYAVGKGLVSADSLPGIATLIVTIVTVGYGIFKTHQNRQKLIVAAEAAPNSVAKVTG